MRIEVEWLGPFNGPDEIRHSSAAIKIGFGSENATRFEDDWSQSVHDRAPLSAYPLALWLASSWWRIRWEPFPSRIRLLSTENPADPDWRLSHELPAAGYGFIWPRLTFVSDGERISALCQRSPALSCEPVRYLSEFNASVPAGDFERETDHFIQLVLRRLDKLGKTELHILWDELLSERADPAQAAARRIEARLGYDPDDAPWEVVERLFELASDAGAEAADEIAPVCAGDDPSQTLRDVIDLARRPGIQARLSLPADLIPEDNTAAPWVRGQRSANALRKSLGSGTQPLNDHELSELLQIPTDYLRNPTESAFRAPMGLAVRTANTEGWKLLFRKRSHPARRFEAARFIADYVLSTPDDRWLPVTNTSTARQKQQRAFAAEFLCPIESLKEYLGDQFLPEAFEDAAEHFGISELAIKSHLANHHLIPHTLVEASDSVPDPVREPSSALLSK